MFCFNGTGFFLHRHAALFLTFRRSGSVQAVSYTHLPGTMTALVGPSGSGKSTVAKLIAGYWDVTSGSITLGGHEPVSYTHL